jgi:hypothetical protein
MEQDALRLVAASLNDDQERLVRALTLLVAVSEQVLLELDGVASSSEAELGPSVAKARDAAVEALTNRSSASKVNEL